MKISGIDFSISSPAMTVTESNDFSHCKFYSYSNNKKGVREIDALGYSNITLEANEPEENQLLRFDRISNFFISIIEKETPDAVYLEAYSFGSRGKIDVIVENTAILKYKLYKLGIPIFSIAPTSVKKFATGSGKADKIEMAKSFLERTKIDLGFDFQKGIKNPQSDIVDSYFLALYGLNQITK